jgi:hypothetical protein
VFHSVDTSDFDGWKYGLKHCSVAANVRPHVARAPFALFTYHQNEMPPQSLFVHPPQPKIVREKVPESECGGSPKRRRKGVTERHRMPHYNATEAGAGCIRVQRSSWEQGKPPHAFVVAASARTGIKSACFHENHLRIGLHDVEQLHGGKCGKVLVRYQVADVCGVAAGR